MHQAILGILCPLCDYQLLPGGKYIQPDQTDYFVYLCLGLLYSVLITSVLTDAIKDAVGRPRPDFFWRCFPDGKGVCLFITWNLPSVAVTDITAFATINYNFLCLGV